MTLYDPRDMDGDGIPDDDENQNGIPDDEEDTSLADIAAGNVSVPTQTTPAPTPVTPQGSSLMDVALAPTPAPAPTVAPSTTPQSLMDLALGSPKPATPASSVTPPSAGQSLMDMALGSPSSSPSIAPKGPWSQMIDTMRDNGQWGDQFGAPVGMGHVEVGGTVVGGTPSTVSAIVRGGGGASFTGPSTLPAQMDTSSKTANLQQWAPTLLSLQNSTGLNANAVAAIILAENGGGQSNLSANQNNYFSISNVGNKYQVAGAEGRFGTYKTPQDSLNHFIELVSTNPRYKEAWDNRADPEKFWAGLIKGGYIVPEPGFPVETWMKNLRSGAQEFGELAKNVQPAPEKPSTTTGGREIANVPNDTGSNSGSLVPLKGITPSQAALDDPDKWAMCGPVAIAAMSAAAGKPISMETAKAVAARNGWTPDQGMSNGPTGVVASLRELGVNTVNKAGVDWQDVARRVQSGEAVTVDSPSAGGKIGHYFVVEGYDPATGKFNFGNSLLSLNDNIHGRNPWATPDELIAMGSKTTLNMNPTSTLQYTSRPEGATNNSMTRSTASTADTTIMTQGTPTRSTGQPVIRGDVGNRPITLWDIALGDWKPPATYATPPPPPRIIEAPRPAAGTSVTSATQTPAQLAARSPGSEDALLAQANKDAFDAEQAKSKAYRDKTAEIMAEMKKTAEQNVTYAQSGVDDWVREFGGTKRPTEDAGDGGSAGFTPTPGDLNAQYSPSALLPYAEIEKPPATPLLDKRTAEYNKEQLDKWVAEGSNPSTKPETVYTPTEIYNIMTTTRQEAMDREQEFATRYFNASEDQRAAVKRDIDIQIARQMDKNIVAAGGQPSIPYGPVDAQTLEEVRPAQEQELDAVNTRQAAERSGIRLPMPEGPSAPSAADRFADDDGVLPPKPTRLFQSTEEIEALPVGTPAYPSVISMLGLSEEEQQARINQAKDEFYASGRMTTTDRNALLAAFRAQDRERNVNRDLPRDAEGRVITQQYDQYGPQVIPQSVRGVAANFNTGITGAASATAGVVQLAADVVHVPSVWKWAESRQVELGRRNATDVTNNDPNFDYKNPSTYGPGLTKSVAQSLPTMLISTGVGSILRAGTVLGLAARGGTTAAEIAATRAAVAAAEKIGQRAAIFTLEGGGAYNDAVEGGARDPAVIGITQGTINTILEDIPMLKNATALERVSFGNRLAHNLIRGVANVAAEGTQEVFQELVGAALDATYKDVPDLTNRLITAFASGAAMGAPGSVLENSVFSNLPPSGRQSNGVTTNADGSVEGKVTQASSQYPDRPQTGFDTPPGLPGTVDSNFRPPASSPAAAPVSDTISPNAPDIVGYRENLVKSNARVNERNLSTRRQSFDDVLDGLDTPPDEHARSAAGNPVTTTERVVLAAENLAQAQSAFGGTLNTDQRSAILNHYGITDQNQRVNAAMAGAQMHENSDTHGQVVAAIHRTYAQATEGTSPDAMVFNREFQRGHPTSQATRTPPTDNSVDGNAHIFYRDENGNPTTTPSPSQRADAEARAARPMPPPVRPTGRSGPDPSVDPNPVQNVRVGPNGTVDVSTAAGVSETFLHPDSQPNNRVLNGGMIIMNKPTRGSFMEAVRAAYRAEGNPDGFAAVQQAVAQATGRKRLPTITDVMEAIQNVSPDKAEAVMRHMNVSGWRSGDTNVGLGTQSGPMAPTGPESAPVAPQTPSGTASAPREGPSSDLPPGQRRVYITSDRLGVNQAFEKANRAGVITSPGETLSVAATPTEGNQLGIDAPIAVPAIVNESDVITHPDGTISLRTPNGFIEPIAYGTSARPKTPSQLTQDRAKVGNTAHQDPEVVYRNIDRLHVPVVPGTGSTLSFQKGEISHERRDAIAASKSVKDLTKALKRVVTKTIEQLRIASPEIPESARFRGIAFIPGILGFTNGGGVDPTAYEHAITINPFTAYLETAVWAEAQGIDIESDEFRRQYSGVLAGTTIHEGSHLATAEGTDAGGHGGSHAQRMVDAVMGSDVDVEAIERTIYAALTPENIAELGNIAEELHRGIDADPSTIAPATEAPAAATPVEESSAPVDTPIATESDVVSEKAADVPVRGGISPILKPTGNPNSLSLLDANKPLSERRGFWVGHASRAVSSVVFDGDNPVAKNIKDRSVADVGQRHERASEAQKAFLDEVKTQGRHSTKNQNTLLDIFKALDVLEAKYPNLSDKVAQAMRVNGYTYTDEVGNKQSVVFPHAQQGENNGLQRATEPRADSRAIDGGSTAQFLRGNERTGNTATSTSDSESGRTLQPSDQQTSRDADVSRTPASNGRNGPIDERTGSGVGRQAQPAQLDAQPSNYKPGSSVERDDNGRVVRSTPTEKVRNQDGTIKKLQFWSNSQKAWVPALSQTEITYMQQLEAAMDLPSTHPDHVVEWRSGKDLDGNPVGVPITIMEEGRYGSFYPDFWVHKGDGTNTIVEIKNVRGIEFEEGQYNAETDKISHSWRVARKAISMIASLRGFSQHGPVSFEVIGSADPRLTGKNPTAAQARDIAAYKQLSDLSKIPFEERFNAITDPQDKQIAIYAAVRSAALPILRDTFTPITGRTRIGASTVFVADPTIQRTPSTKPLQAVVPEARGIIAEMRDKFGVNARNIGVSVAQENVQTPTGAVIDVVGDVAATELMAAELAKSADSVDDPGTFIFREDFRGTDRLNSFDIPYTDDALADALMGLSEPNKPTVHTVINEDGTANVTLASRTPDGTRLTPAEFEAARDNFKAVLEDHMGAPPINNVDQRGVITHFGETINDKHEYVAGGNIDDTIAQLREELGQTPLGGSFRNTGPLRSFANLRGAPTVPASRSSTARANRSTIDQQVENLSEGTTEAPVEDMPPDLTARFQQASPPGPQNTVPNFDAKKFSRDLRGKIKATAETIHKNNALPADVIRQARVALGLSEQEYNQSYASNLTPIEQAAILMNLSQQKHAMDTVAKNLSTAQTAPTQDEVRDFILQGMNYRAMYAQLTGRKDRMGDAARIATDTKMKTGETADLFAKRIMNYSRTSPGKASDFARNFIRGFHHMGILGATPRQIDTAWEQALHPKTTVGDWMLGIMYSAMLGVRTAANALVFNTAEVLWRGGLDMITTTPIEAFSGSWEAFSKGQGLGKLTDAVAGFEAGAERGIKISAAEAAGFTYGMGRGFVALMQTIATGSSNQQYAMEDLPPNRLTNNKLGPGLSQVANAVGYGLDIFWNRFFQGADAFAKSWSYSMQMGREAAIESARRNNGKVDWAQTQALFDQPTADMMAKSHRVALETAMQGEVGETIGGITTRAQNIPYIGRALFPFLRTLYHNANRGFERTPFGILIIGQRALASAPGESLFGKIAHLNESDYLRGIANQNVKAARPWGEVMRDSLVGTFLMATFSQLFDDGLLDITGEPPDDDRERDQWQRKGKTAFSISSPKIADGAYFSYTNMGPMGIGLSAIAEWKSTRKRLAEKTDKQTEAAIIGHGLSNFSAGLIELTYLQSATTLSNALSQDSNDKANTLSSNQLYRYAEQQLLSRIPFGASFQNMGQFEDEFNRYPNQNDIGRRLPQLIASKMPMEVPFIERYLPYPDMFKRGSIPVQNDVWGFPTKNPYHGAMAFSPVRVSQRRSDPVDDEIKRLQDNGVDVRPTKAAHEYEGHTFTDDEYYEWQRRVGQNSYTIINVMKESDIYRNAPMTGVGSKEQMVKAAYLAAHETAWDSLQIVDPGKEPDRAPEYYGIKEEAAKRGVPWWQYEKEVKKSVSAWNDWQDALKTGRKPPDLTPEERRQGAIYSTPGMRNKLLTMDKRKGVVEVKKAISNVEDYIPFNAVP